MQMSFNERLIVLNNYGDVTVCKKKNLVNGMALDPIIQKVDDLFIFSVKPRAELI